MIFGAGEGIQSFDINLGKVDENKLVLENPVYYNQNFDSWMLSVLHLGLRK